MPRPGHLVTLTYLVLTWVSCVTEVRPQRLATGVFSPSTGVHPSTSVFGGSLTAFRGHTKQLYPSRRLSHNKQLWPSRGLSHTRQLYPSRELSHTKQLYPSRGLSNTRQLYPSTSRQERMDEDVLTTDQASLDVNVSKDEYSESWSDKEKQQWLQHQFLQRQLECHRRQLQEDGDNISGVWCPRVWDKMLCWDPAAPNTTLTLPCPHYIPGILTQGVAVRVCGPKGEWEEGGGGGEGSSGDDDGGEDGGRQGWTNYTECIPASTGPDLSLHNDWVPTIKRISVVGYSISLATLVISFIILASLRKLRCPRNLLHLHLFASFILRAVVVVFRSSVLVHGGGGGGGGPLEDLGQHQQKALQEEEEGEGYYYGSLGEQTWVCKFVISVWQYFILANYSWLLMEGLYLHSLIFLALFTDSSAITLYVMLGWGLPLGCVSLWVTLRATLDDEHCWTVNNVQWIFWLTIRAPVALSNLINFFFFINVVRVLGLKLRSSVSNEPMIYRKLCRSTLVLLPLFGVHYFLLWTLSTSTNARVELVWLFLDQVFASFQGFFVAVLYCLMNGEVRQELRKLYSRWCYGDSVVLNSHSTQLSHTKTYTSRARMSLPSIHSQGERRDLRTPSPLPMRSRGSDATFSTTTTTTTNNSPFLNHHHYTLQPGNRDIKVGHRASSECCDEDEGGGGGGSREIQPGLSTSSLDNSSRHPSSSRRNRSPRFQKRRPSLQHPPIPASPMGEEGTPVEVLIELQEHETLAQRSERRGSKARSSDGGSKFFGDLKESSGSESSKGLKVDTDSEASRGSGGKKCSETRSGSEASKGSKVHKGSKTRRRNLEASIENETSDQGGTSSESEDPTADLETSANKKSKAQSKLQNQRQFSKLTDDSLVKQDRVKLNGSVVNNTIRDNGSKTICVTIKNKDSKLSTPVQIESHILKKCKNSENETML